MEKQIHITKLNAKYNKDFDTFGKMDPFLVFKIGKSQAKTETANSQGKTPVWNTEIIMTYLDQSTMTITSYDEDTMSNDYMGLGTVDLKKLKASGLLQIKIQEKGELIGTVFGEYLVKTLPPSPLLLIKNIKCDFFKQTKFILKAKPYFSLGSGSHNMVTEVSQEANGKKLSWNDTLRVKIKQTNPVVLSLLDKDDNNSEIFKYECKIDQFKTSAGKKQFYVHDKYFEPLGVLQFQFETINIVNRQQSVKNEEKRKQQQNQMAKVTIQKIRGNLQKDGIDVYFKILCGPNMVMTDAINSAPKNFEMNNQIPFYAQSKENKITFALWDKNLISDDVVGVGYLTLPTTAGQKQIQLKNRNGDSRGSIFVTVSLDKITAKSICFQDIRLNLLEKGDLIGSSQPYIIGRIGGWSGRTQTAEGQTVSFKKPLNLKFNDEDKVFFEVWDEDITSHDKLFVQSYDLSKLKKKSGEITVPLGDNKGEIKMKFTTKNFEQPAAAPQSPTKKPTQSKKQSIKKQSKKQIVDIQKVQKVQVKLQKIQIQNAEEKPPTQKQKVPTINKEKNNHQNSVDYHSIDQSNRSKNTFKLPAIQHRNFGDKIFDKQSSSTLQKSIHVYSMPKAPRFGQGPKYAGEPSYYVETSFKNNSGKGVGFGFGNKRQFPQWLQKNMKENPAPSAYFENRGNSTDGYRSRGPTFGIGHKYYEKVMIPKQKAFIRNSLQRIHRTDDKR